MLTVLNQFDAADETVTGGWRDKQNGGKIWMGRGSVLFFKSIPVRRDALTTISARA